MVEAVAGEAFRDELARIGDDAAEGEGSRLPRYSIQIAECRAQNAERRMQYVECASRIWNIEALARRREYIDGDR